MAVLHYKNGDSILCGTKAKTYKHTDDKTTVTCKRCLGKFKSNKVKVSKTHDFVILSVKRVEMKFPLRGKIDHFMLSIPDGSVFTSCGLYGTQVKRAMSTKDRTDISNTLKSLKNDNNGLYAEDIYKEYHI